MRAEALVELPAGYWDEQGRRHRDATVVALSGADEEWAQDLAPDAPLAGAALDLLSRCVRSIGTVTADRAVLAELPVGDLDLLLLQLWGLSFGPRLEMVLSCPAGDCGARMTVDLAFDEPPPERVATGPAHRLEIEDPDVPEVVLRLPSGGDLEGLAGVGTSPVEALLGRCVLRAGAASGPDAAALVARSPALRAAVEREMERLAPVGDELEADCPECGREFAVAFSPGMALIAELQARRSELERDVHLLSWHYHWPLAEILAMARPRRRSYVELLLTHVERAVPVNGG